MKFTTLIFITSCIVAINGQFSKNLENLNVDMILKNDRILTNYLKCVLDKGEIIWGVNELCKLNLHFIFFYQGPCTNEGRELKTTLPNALKTGCKKCSENERRSSRKVILHLIEKKPRDWAQIEKKYDPTGEFTREFRKNIDA